MIGLGMSAPRPSSSLHRVRKSVREVFLPDGRDPFGGVGTTLLLVFVAIGPFLYGSVSELAARAFPGGAVRPTGALLLGLLAFAAAAAAAFSKSRLAAPRPLRVPLAAVIALAGFGIVQILPLPVEVLTRIAPANLKTYHEAGEILTLFSEGALGPRISIAPGETLERVLLFLSYAALFLAAAALLRSRPRRRVFAATLVGAAAIRILLAAGPEFSGHPFPEAFDDPRAFAAYLLIVLSVAFGTLWAEVLMGPDRAPATADKAERFEKRFLPLTVRFLAWGLIAVGIAWTESRAGILVAAITTLILLALAVVHRRIGFRRRAAMAGALAVLAAALFVATAAGPFRPFLEADARELGANWRVRFWRVALETWRESPLVGSGLGTFPEAFRRVQPREIVGPIEHVHSDFLQLLVTGGYVGTALGFLLFTTLLGALFMAWRRQRHREESALALAGIGSLVAVVLHGLLEFNFSVPVIPATLACVLGSAWAAGSER